VAQVLDWMAENLCVDMDRVFITGFSNGGQRGMLPQGGLKFTGLTQNLGQL
jgi:poly(3-hydroxybutyrate) depolymerase